MTSKPGGKVAMPATHPARALPDEARAVAGGSHKLRNQPSHEAIIFVGCIIVAAVLVTNAVGRIGHDGIDGGQRRHDVKTIAPVERGVADDDFFKLDGRYFANGVAVRNERHTTLLSIKNSESSEWVGVGITAVRVRRESSRRLSVRHQRRKSPAACLL